MNCRIRAFEKKDYERVLNVCVSAFTPIHRAFEEALGSKIFDYRYHDWREQYADYLGRISNSDPAVKVYVVEDAGALVAFVVTIMDCKRKIGEIGLNAVAPEHQGKGIGEMMYAFALKELKERGAEVAYVGTGGDSAHAPARAAYEAVGFDRAIPAVHYFRTL
jgi:ribosomal protein S18 acetylase RimI-like enzyme